MTIKLPPPTIEWVGGLDGYVELIDQTRLPEELVKLRLHDPESVRTAIKTLQVRGAPAIGIAAAMGAVLGTRHFSGDDRAAFLTRLDEVCRQMATARPTAVNLGWALRRLQHCAARDGRATVSRLKQLLHDEARRIRDEDEVMCRAIGRHGLSLATDGTTILTHCNAGSLATARLGTALAPIYSAHEQGRRLRVFVAETRPLLQGSRLTAWELQQAGIDVTLICDSAVAAVMQAGKIDLIITGADRIAANGDVANKIGTYGVAALAQVHDVPFYVAAPSSTFDLTIRDGSQIPIEQREPDEIRCGFGKPTAPADIGCENPAFDVTPARLIRGIVTEHGIIQPVRAEFIARTLGHQDACQDTGVRQ